MTKQIVEMKKMKLRRIALAMLVAFSLASCGDNDPKLTDPEAYEKTVQLNEQYVPLMVGTWHYENNGDTYRFSERLTFQADGTLTGTRNCQTRKLVTIEGEQRYTDWEDFELCGSFSGTWMLKFWSPEGDADTRRNCLHIIANYDDERNYMAFPSVLTFGYANETTLHIQGYFFHDDEGWADYLREEES